METSYIVTCHGCKGPMEIVHVKGTSGESGPAEQGFWDMSCMYGCGAKITIFDDSTDEFMWAHLATQKALSELEDQIVLDVVDVDLLELFVKVRDQATKLFVEAQKKLGETPLVSTFAESE